MLCNANIPHFYVLLKYYALKFLKTLFIVNN